MKIELHTIKVRDLAVGYRNDEEEGVVAYGGRLDVRPKYQREFIYKPEQQQAVVDTVTKGYPLNVMYWAVREDGTYEVIDGQQRTLSVCEYVAGRFAYMFRYFGNLTQDEQDAILDYELTVYFCEGTDSEKLEWFKTINIAGEELTDQELLNAVYAGPCDRRSETLLLAPVRPSRGTWRTLPSRRPDPTGLSRYGAEVEERGRREEVHGDPPAQAVGGGRMALLQGSHRLGGDAVPEVPQGDEWAGVGASLQGVRREVVQPRRAGEGGGAVDGRQGSAEQQGHIRVSPFGRFEAREAEPSAVRRRREARGVRDAEGHMPPLRTALRDRGDGGRPRRPVVEGRKDSSREPPDAVQEVQRTERRQVRAERENLI